MSTKTITIRGQGISVDLLRFREYRGAYDRVTTKEILDLNPGLAELGFVIPIGTVVRLPILEDRKAPARAPVTLWS